MIRLLLGDCRDILRTLADESVHCVVTSPPYWGLRDYGIAGQLGLEDSLGEYVETMVGVFREVRRVLRKDGTLWLNLGDSYASTPNGSSANDTKLKGNDDRTFRDKPFSTVGPIGRPGHDGHGGFVNHKNRNGLAGFDAGYLKPKDMCGVPWRVAFALQADGWWLRQDIIWAKPNPMPESVTDRCTKAHEYVFLLSRSERYYYDQQAIKEKAQYPEGSGNIVPCKGANTDGFQIRGSLHKAGPLEFRNKRSVWEINTQPFSESHFATFPAKLVEPMILAGCPKGGTVLDPFGGAGTAGLVADRLQRNAILIELKPEYIAMTERRIAGDAPLFMRIQRDMLECLDA